MAHTLTFAELDAQHVELLPARTVLSLFSVGKPGKGGKGFAGMGWNIDNRTYGGEQTFTAGQGVAGAPGTGK